MDECRPHSIHRMRGTFGSKWLTPLRPIAGLHHAFGRPLRRLHQVMPSSPLRVKAADVGYGTVETLKSSNTIVSLAVVELSPDKRNPMAVTELRTVAKESVPD